MILPATITLAMVALIAALMTRAWITSSPDFIGYGGIQVFVDRKIADKIDRDQFDRLIASFVNHMCPQCFNRSELYQHVGKISCHLRAKKIAVYGMHYNGCTTNKYKIEVACDPQLFGRGKVDLRKTALLYELLNASIWMQEGYDVAIAEAPPSPNDTPQQARMKALRAPYNKRFRALEV